MTYGQLELYKDACVVCEEREVSSLTENTPIRYLLDGVWNRGGVDECLMEGFWEFAIRTIQMDYDPSFLPSFGYQRVFGQPADFIRTAALSADAYFNDPFKNYTKENGYWYADIDTLFLKFVSNRNDYGTNMNTWPTTFRSFAAAHFAGKIIGAITHAKVSKDDVQEQRQGRLMSARSKDQMEQPSKDMPRGRWSRARFGRSFTGGQGGPGGSY